MQFPQRLRDARPTLGVLKACRAFGERFVGHFRDSFHNVSSRCARLLRTDGIVPAMRCRAVATPLKPPHGIIGRIGTDIQRFRRIPPEAVLRIAAGPLLAETAVAGEPYVGKLPVLTGFSALTRGWL